MKKLLLLLILFIFCFLYSFGNGITMEQAERESFKYDYNTHFALIKNDTFFIFYKDDFGDLTYLTCTSVPNEIEVVENKEEETTESTISSEDLERIAKKILKWIIGFFVLVILYKIIRGIINIFI